MAGYGGADAYADEVGKCHDHGKVGQAKRYRCQGGSIAQEANEQGVGEVVDGADCHGEDHG